MPITNAERHSLLNGNPQSHRDYGYGTAQKVLNQPKFLNQENNQNALSPRIYQTVVKSPRI